MSHTVNNAQIASVLGHPLSLAFQQSMQARVAAGKRWPLEATGPHLLTDIVRVSVWHFHTHTHTPVRCLPTLAVSTLTTCELQTRVMHLLRLRFLHVAHPGCVVLQVLTGNAKGGLPGAYHLADGSRLAVYGPKQWMTPCGWNDWTCGECISEPSRPGHVEVLQDRGHCMLPDCLWQRPLTQNLYCALR